MPTKAARKTQSANDNGNSSSLLNSEKLRTLYASMLRSRMVSEKTRALFDQSGAMTGQEAAEVGCAVSLKRGDYVVTCNPVMNVARNMSLNLVFAHLYSGNGKPGTSLNIGLGMALAFQKQEKPFITLAFMDDSPLGDALKYAGKHKLPMIFIVRQSISGGTNGIPSIEVDGNDVVAIYRVAQEAIRRAREGRGPTVIACNHEAVSDKDPLTFMENYLRRRNLWSDSWKQTLIKDFTKEIETTVTAFTQTAHLREG